MTILQWVLDVVRDPERYGGFKADPETMIRTAEELTENQKNVLLSRDPERIRHVIEYELGIDPEASQYAMHLVFPIPMHNGFDTSSA